MRKPGKRLFTWSRMLLLLGIMVCAVGLGLLTLYRLGYAPSRILSRLERAGKSTFADTARKIKFELLAGKNVPMPENTTPQAIRIPDNPPTHGPLRVSKANPRYFEDQSGSVIYLTGSHTWSNLIDNGGEDPPPAFDYPQYLQFLVDNHHNFFRLWTWEQSRWTLETADDHYWFSIQPYVRTGPGNALDGKPKFDLTQFNQAYFDRLRERILQARAKGIYVSVMLFDGWSINSAKAEYQFNNPWHGHPFNSHNNINGINGDPNNLDTGAQIQTLSNPDITAIQEAYVRKVIDTVNDLDNVLYEIDNEGDGASIAWQYHMIEVVKQDEASKPYQHPVGMTAAFPNGNNQQLYDSPADWISPNGDINNPLAGDGRKVVLIDPDHLCGVCGERSFAWKSLAQGLNPLFMDGYDGKGYGVGGVDFNGTDPIWVSLRKNLGYARAYAERIDLAHATPRSDLCSTAYCLANLTKGYAQVLVYDPQGDVVSVDLREVVGKASAEWFNPANSQIFPIGTIAGEQVSVFTPPFTGDAVLFISQPDP